MIPQNLNELTVIKSSIFVGFFQKIILQLIQVHRETDLMETMEVKYFSNYFKSDKVINRAMVLKKLS
jgi:hypothetical protein